MEGKIVQRVMCGTGTSFWGTLNHYCFETWSFETLRHGVNPFTSTHSESALGEVSKQDKVCEVRRNPCQVQGLSVVDLRTLYSNRMGTVSGETIHDMLCHGLFLSGKDLGIVMASAFTGVSSMRPVDLWSLLVFPKIRYNIFDVTKRLFPFCCLSLWQNKVASCYALSLLYSSAGISSRCPCLEGFWFWCCTGVTKLGSLSMAVGSPWSCEPFF